MRKVTTWVMFLCFISPAAFSSTVPPTEGIIPAGRKISQEVILKKILSLKTKDLQKLAGRKISLKEKISFLLLKKKLKRKLNDTTKEGKTSLIFGISALALLVIGLFVPYVILGSIVASIIAIVIGGSASRKDPSDRKARLGKLLGWISIGLTIALFLIVLLVVLAFVDSW